MTTYIPQYSQPDWEAELFHLKQDCARLLAKLVAASVTPPAAPTAVNFRMADRSQWIAYHAALIASCAAHTIAYISTTGQ
jgi:hypothetical protein